MTVSTVVDVRGPCSTPAQSRNVPAHSTASTMASPSGMPKQSIGGTGGDGGATTAAFSQWDRRNQVFYHSCKHRNRDVATTRIGTRIYIFVFSVTYSEYANGLKESNAKSIEIFCAVAKVILFVINLAWWVQRSSPEPGHLTTQGAYERLTPSNTGLLAHRLCIHQHPRCNRRSQAGLCD